MNENAQPWEGEQNYGFNSQLSNDLVQQYQVLYDEHQELVKELLETRDNYEKANSEKESLMKFYQNLKQQLQNKVEESESDKKKIRDLELSYRELDDQAKAEIRNLKNKMEMMKRDMEDKEDRQSRQEDPEVQRVRIKKEVQAIFNSELSAKQYQIEKLQDEIHESKRSYDALKITYDWYKEDKEKELAEIKNKHKADMNETIMEMQALQHKLEGKYKIHSHLFNTFL